MASNEISYVFNLCFTIYLLIIPLITAFQSYMLYLYVKQGLGGLE